MLPACSPRVRFVVATLLALAGCIRATPDAGLFAGDAGVGVAGDGQLADASAADGAGDAASSGDADASADDTADAGSADAGSADAGSADAATTGGPCSTGLELHDNTIDGGGADFLHGAAAIPGGGALLVGGIGNGGSSADGWVVRIGAFGKPLWNKTFGGADADRLDAGIVLASGGFVVAGKTRLAGQSQADGWLVALGADGAQLWQKTFGGAGEDGFTGIADTGKGYVLAGSNRSVGNQQDHGWLLKVDADGKQVWEQTFGGKISDRLHSVVVDGADSVAAVGTNRSDAKLGTDLWLVRTTFDGSVLTDKVYGHGENDEGHGIAPLQGGGLLLTGRASDGGNPKLWALAVDGTGSVLWKDVYGGNQSEVGRAAVQASDGTLWIAGETSSSWPGVFGGDDGWLLRYDRFGNRLGDWQFGGDANDNFEALVAAPDGGVLAVGHRVASGQLEGWFVRVNAWGQSSCTAAGACAELTPGDCDDGDACTLDGCAPTGGCSHTQFAVGTTCAPGAVCTAKGCVGG